MSLDGDMADGLPVAEFLQADSLFKGFDAEASMRVGDAVWANVGGGVVDAAAGAAAARGRVVAGAAVDVAAVRRAAVDVALAHEDELAHAQVGHRHRRVVAADRDHVVAESHLAVLEHVADLLVQAHAAEQGVQPLLQRLAGGCEQQRRALPRLQLASTPLRGHSPWNPDGEFRVDSYTEAQKGEICYLPFLCKKYAGIILPADNGL